MLPANRKPPRPDPYFIILGGPGVSVTQYADTLSEQFARIREHRDVVLLDLRGTGGSHPLNCDLYGPPANLEADLGDEYPPKAVKSCRDSLEHDSDLTQYTTPIAMDDLDDVRAALGYKSINLFGLSYGSRAALIYAKRHAEHLRSLTLQAIDPLDSTADEDAQNVQAAVDGLLRECETDARCRSAFPTLRNDLEVVGSQLAKSPAGTDVLNPVTGDAFPVEISLSLFQEVVRTMLYAPESAELLPVIIHQASQHDFTPLAETALFDRQQSTNGTGLFFSVACVEYVPAGGTYSRLLKSGIAVGDAGLSSFLAACRLWPRGKLPADYRTQVRISIPTLMFSGSLDPMCPPSNAVKLAQYLPLSQHIVVPDGGHMYDGMIGQDCIEKIRAEFVEQGNAKGLDVSCMTMVKPPPFRTQALQTKVVPLSTTQVAAFIGEYYSKDTRLQARVNTTGMNLRLEVTGKPTTILAPVGPALFRIAGLPGFYVRFKKDANNAEQLDIEQNDTVLMSFGR